jgi:hypothetical protein
MSRMQILGMLAVGAYAIYGSQTLSSSAVQTTGEVSLVEDGQAYPDAEVLDTFSPGKFAKVDYTAPECLDQGGASLTTALGQIYFSDQ